MGEKTNTFILWGGQTLEQVAQRSWGVSATGDSQNLTRQDLEHPAPVNPALSMQQDQTIARGPFQPELFCNSVDSKERIC